MEDRRIVKSPKTCERCWYSSELCNPPTRCERCQQHFISALGTPLCRCDLVKTGTQCPYFREVRE